MTHGTPTPWPADPHDPQSGRRALNSGVTSSRLRILRKHIAEYRFAPSSALRSMPGFAQVSAAVRVLSLQMSKKYEIRSGRRTVSIQYSVSALQAVVDYVRTFGCSDDEIRRLGVDSVAWRGARFSAVLVPAEPKPAE